MHKAEITVSAYVFSSGAYMRGKINIWRAPVHVWTLTHHRPHMLLHTSLQPTVTKHVFCHLQTQTHSAEQPRPHTHTKDPDAEELCVRSTSQAGKTSGKGLCSSKLLLNELIRHWYAKSCYKESELEAEEKKEEGRWWWERAREQDRSEIWSYFIGSQKQITSTSHEKLIWFE